MDIYFFIKHHTTSQCPSIVVLLLFVNTYYAEDWELKREKPESEVVLSRLRHCFDFAVSFHIRANAQNGRRGQEHSSAVK